MIGGVNGLRVARLRLIANKYIKVKKIKVQDGGMWMQIEKRRIWENGKDQL